MHSNRKLSGIQSAALLGVGQKPNTTQNLIRKSGAFEYLLRNFAYTSNSNVRDPATLEIFLGEHIPEIIPL
jgi:hypothetical protein